VNISDFIRRSEFLDKIFPDGLDRDVHIGQINLDMEGRISLNLHTRQKPAVEVNKWGRWGTDYNIIVVELNGTGCSDIAIRNWKLASFGEIHFIIQDGQKVLHQKGGDWEINFDFDDFIFQRCSVYIE